MNFHISNYFDLEFYKWKGLFNNEDLVWENLKNIDTYIDQVLEKSGEQYLLIDSSSILQDTARIEGKAIIGKNCIVGHGVLLRDGVILGDNVSIGHGGEVKHSIILNDTSIAHLNYVGDSIIGNNVNISGGAILANLRFDNQEVAIKNGDEKISTGLKKFGSVVGDGSTIGVNSVLNPGTLIGKKSIVFPLTSAKGYYPEHSVVKEK